MTIDLAVIGGSGLYAFEGLEDTERQQVETPFGPPSAFAHPAGPRLTR